MAITAIYGNHDLRRIDCSSYAGEFIELIIVLLFFHLFHLISSPRENDMSFSLSNGPI